MKKMSHDDFLAKARKIHGSLYDYRLVNYVNSRTPISIVCPIHGVYRQTPHNHLKGQRCGQCFSNRALTTEEFVKRSVEKHGNRYGYEKSFVSKAQDLVEILCPLHGFFLQTASSHMKGHHCFKCGRLTAQANSRLTTEDFIARSNLVHNHTYDYTKTKVADSVEKVVVTCPTHGDFFIRPSGHLSGNGCRECANIRIGNSSRLSTAAYIERASKVHESFFSYEKTVYVGGDKKVIITCPRHGDFKQTASAHLEGDGCSKCHFENMSLDRRLSKEEFIKRANKKHHGFYDYSQSEYVNNNTKIRIKCHKHGVFEQTPASHFNGKGCPVCKFSKGELFLLGLFKEVGILYKTQYKLPIYKFEYDFYLPEYNAFVEFHGVQHYKPVDCFGGEDAFLELKKRDLFKLELSRLYGISMVYFNHTHLKNLNGEEFKKLVLDTLQKLKDRKATFWVCIGE